MLKADNLQMQLFLPQISMSVLHNPVFTKEPVMTKLMTTFANAPGDLMVFIVRSVSRTGAHIM